MVSSNSESQQISLFMTLEDRGLTRGLTEARGEVRAFYEGIKADRRGAIQKVPDNTIRSYQRYRGQLTLVKKRLEEVNAELLRMQALAHIPGTVRGGGSQQGRAGQQELPIYRRTTQQGMGFRPQDIQRLERVFPQATRALQDNIQRLETRWQHLYSQLPRAASFGGQSPVQAVSSQQAKPGQQFFGELRRIEQNTRLQKDFMYGVMKDMAGQQPPMQVGQASTADIAREQRRAVRQTNRERPLLGREHAVRGRGTETWFEESSKGRVTQRFRDLQPGGRKRFIGEGAAAEIEDRLEREYRNKIQEIEDDAKLLSSEAAERKQLETTETQAVPPGSSRRKATPNDLLSAMRKSTLRVDEISRMEAGGFVDADVANVYREAQNLEGIQTAFRRQWADLGGDVKGADFMIGKQEDDIAGQTRPRAYDEAFSGRLRKPLQQQLRDFDKAIASEFDLQQELMHMPQVDESTVRTYQSRMQDLDLEGKRGGLRSTFLQQSLVDETWGPMDPSQADDMISQYEESSLYKHQQGLNEKRDRDRLQADKRRENENKRVAQEQERSMRSMSDDDRSAIRARRQQVVANQFAPTDPEMRRFTARRGGYRLSLKDLDNTLGRLQETLDQQSIFNPERQRTRGLMGRVSGKREFVAGKIGQYDALIGAQRQFEESETKYREYWRKKRMGLDAKTAQYLTQTTTGLVGLTAMLSVVGMAMGGFVMQGVMSIAEYIEKVKAANQQTKEWMGTMVNLGFSIQDSVKFQKALNSELSKEEMVGIGQAGWRTKRGIAGSGPEAAPNLSRIAGEIKDAYGLEEDQAGLVAAQLVSPSSDEFDAAVSTLGVEPPPKGVAVTRDFKRDFVLGQVRSAAITQRAQTRKPGEIGTPREVSPSRMGVGPDITGRATLAQFGVEPYELSSLKRSWNLIGDLNSKRSQIEASPGDDIDKVRGDWISDLVALELRIDRAILSLEEQATAGNLSDSHLKDFETNKEKAAELAAFTNSLMERVGRTNSIGSLTDVDIPGFRQGGHVSQDQLAMVGEGGPELVQLPGGSNVIPNNAIQNAMVNTEGFRKNWDTVGNITDRSTRYIYNDIFDFTTELEQLWGHTWDNLGRTTTENWSAIYEQVSQTPDVGGSSSKSIGAITWLMDFLFGTSEAEDESGLQTDVDTSRTAAWENIKTFVSGLGLFTAFDNILGAIKWLMDFLFGSGGEESKEGLDTDIETSRDGAWAHVVKFVTNLPSIKFLVGIISAIKWLLDFLFGSGGDDDEGGLDPDVETSRDRAWKHVKDFVSNLPPIAALKTIIAAVKWVLDFLFGREGSETESGLEPDATTSRTTAWNHVVAFLGELPPFQTLATIIAGINWLLKFLFGKNESENSEALHSDSVLSRWNAWYGLKEFLNVLPGFNPHSMILGILKFALSMLFGDEADIGKFYENVKEDIQAAWEGLQEALKDINLIDLIIPGKVILDIISSVTGAVQKRQEEEEGDLFTMSRGNTVDMSTIDQDLVEEWLNSHNAGTRNDAMELREELKRRGRWTSDNPIPIAEPKPVEKPVVDDDGDDPPDSEETTGESGLGGDPPEEDPSPDVEVGGADDTVREYLGGPISTNKTALVGERGPELVKLPGGSYVQPNHSLTNLLAERPRYGFGGDHTGSSMETGSAHQTYEIYLTLEGRVLTKYVLEVMNNEIRKKLPRLNRL